MSVSDLTAIWTVKIISIFNIYVNIVRNVYVNDKSEPSMSELCGW